MSTPTPSNKDGHQVLKYAFDDSTGRLRTDAVISPDGHDLEIHYTDDSIAIGDPASDHILAINADGSINATISGSVTGSTVKIEDTTGAALNSNGAGALKVDASATTQPISAVSLPLPTGAATALKQDTGNTSLASIDSKLSTTNSELTTINTTLGSPFQAGGSIGNTSFIAIQSSGTNLHTNVDNFPATQSVTQGTSPWVTNINNGAGVSAVNIQDGGNSITVDGTIAATQSGSWSVTANAGTNLNTSALALDTSVNGILVSQASSTSGEKGPLIQGATTTSAPTYTTGTTNPLSLTTAGLLRVDGTGGTFPVTGSVAVGANSVTSTVNSTTTPLGANGVFTGTFENVNGYSEITIVYVSDKSSATNGVVVNFSSDGSNIDSFCTFFFDSTHGNGDTIALPTVSKYVQVVYTNGASAQTYFRLQTQYRAVADSPAAAQFNTVLTDNTIANLTRTLIVGKTTGGGGSYVNVKVNPSGALSSSIGDISGVVGQNTKANSLPVTIASDQGTLTVSDSHIPVNGQTTMSGSIPVTIASDQTSTPYAIRLDNTSTANVTYVGKAAVGSATSSAVWQIQKIDQTSGMIITWAGSAAFNQIWNNRTSLTYA